MVSNNSRADRARSQGRRWFVRFYSSHQTGSNKQHSNQSLKLFNSFPLLHDPIRPHPYLSPTRSHPQRRPSRLHPRLLLYLTNNRIPNVQYKLLPLLPPPRNTLNPIPQSHHRAKEKTTPPRFPRALEIHIPRTRTPPQRRKRRTISHEYLHDFLPATNGARI